MNQTQLAAALRLIDELASVHPLHPYVHMCGSAAALLRELVQEPQSEPVAEVTERDGNAHFKCEVLEGSVPAVGTKLYTAPPQRQPLTEGEIIDATEDIDMARNGYMIRIARAIERAHSIGGKE